MTSIEHTFTPRETGQELAYLQLLSRAEHDEVAYERRFNARQRVQSFSVHDRTEFYAAAVEAVDPKHTLGPYRGLDVPMTAELVEFETWRVARLIDPDDESDGDLATALLCVMDPLMYSYTGMDLSIGHTTRMLLTFGRIDEADFPGFSLIDYLNVHHPGATIEPFPLEEFLALNEEHDRRQLAYQTHRNESA